jgi:transcription initiation factor TFIIIB Brf1 subunit/transcription initiation factor TFIIB
MEMDERIKTQDRAQSSISKARGEIKRVVNDLDQIANYPTTRPSWKGIDVNVPMFLNEQVLTLYKNVISTPLVNNFSIAELISATTYHASRSNNLPHTLKEISFVALSKHFDEEESNLSVPSVERYYNDRYLRMTSQTPYMKMTSSTYQRLRSELSIDSTPVPVRNYVLRYVDDLGLEDDIEEAALVIEKRSEDEIRSGVPPHTFAAGIISVALESSPSDLTIWSGIARQLNIPPDSIHTQKERIKESIR